MKLEILQQDIQTPSIFVSEEKVETKTTTVKGSISPIHPNLTTPRSKNPTLPQVTLQSTVNPQLFHKWFIHKKIHKWIIKHLDQ